MKFVVRVILGMFPNSLEHSLSSWVTIYRLVAQATVSYDQNFFYDRKCGAQIITKFTLHQSDSIYVCLVIISSMGSWFSKNVVNLGDVFPDFQAKTTEGDIRLHDFLGDRYMFHVNVEAECHLFCKCCIKTRDCTTIFLAFLFSIILAINV